jgi:ribosome-binding factor A
MGNPNDRSRGEHSARAGAVRSQRLEELLREELESILSDEVSDPRLDGVSVTLVELSADGSRARVWFGCASGADDARRVERVLERASGFLRTRLCEALPLKRMPELRFRYDPVALLDRDEDDLS